MPLPPQIGIPASCASLAIRAVKGGSRSPSRYPLAKMTAAFDSAAIASTTAISSRGLATASTARSTCSGSAAIDGQQGYLPILSYFGFTGKILPPKPPRSITCNIALPTVSGRGLAPTNAIERGARSGARGWLIPLAFAQTVQRRADREVLVCP